MTDKNVSIIIPTYNRAHVLLKTVPSYFQDVTLEVIIVDDGSDDNTKDIVQKLHKRYVNMKYIVLKKHRGLQYAKNIGIKRAKGKFIFFGDDDAYLYQGTLFRLREAIENFPADIAGANGSYATEMRQIKHMDHYISHYFTEPFNERCILNFDTFKFNFNYKIEKITEGLCVMACFMIRAELARDVKFDMNYIGNADREDIDYLLQQAELGRKMIYVPDTYEIDLPRQIVRKGGCQNRNLSIWKKNIYIIRNHFYFLNKHYSYLKREGYMSISKYKAMMFIIKNMVYQLFIVFEKEIGIK